MKEIYPPVKFIVVTEKIIQKASTIGLLKIRLMIKFGE